MFVKIKNLKIPENLSVGLCSSAGVIFFWSCSFSTMVFCCSAKTGILDGRLFPSLSTEVNSLEIFHFFSVSSSDEELFSLSLPVFLTGILDFWCIGGRRIPSTPSIFSLANREAIANGSRLTPREMINFFEKFFLLFIYIFLFFFSFLTFSLWN